jgi:Icc-related predicted phosphoesterase
MRIGVISDIHNNAVALNRVLEKFHTEGCEQIICCSDMIGIGPYPEETVQRIMQIPDIIAVRGNHERYGHDHKPSVNRDECRLFANFGSLGSPAKDGNVARAGIITIHNGK